MTLEELRKQRMELDAQIAEAERKELEDKQNRVIGKIASYSEAEKAFMLSLLKHDRSSCNDENPWNGWDGERFRCTKCMMMEILEGKHEGKFDFSFDVTISRVSV